MNQHLISATPICLHRTSSNFTRSEESYDTRFTTHSSTFSRGYFPVKLELQRLSRRQPKCELHIRMKCPRLSSKSWRNRAKSDSPILWILMHISGIESFKVKQHSYSQSHIWNLPSIGTRRRTPIPNFLAKLCQFQPLLSLLCSVVCCWS